MCFFLAFLRFKTLPASGNFRDGHSLHVCSYKYFPSFELWVQDCWFCFPFIAARLRPYFYKSFLASSFTVWGYWLSCLVFFLLPQDSEFRLRIYLFVLMLLFSKNSKVPILLLKILFGFCLIQLSTFRFRSGCFGIEFWWTQFRF